MKKVSISLLGILAIVLAVTSAFTTKSNNVPDLKYQIWILNQEAPATEQDDHEYIANVSNATSQGNLESNPNDISGVACTTGQPEFLCVADIEFSNAGGDYEPVDVESFRLGSSF